MKNRPSTNLRLGLFLKDDRGKGRRLLQGIRGEIVHWPEAELEMIPHGEGRLDESSLRRFDAILGEFDSYEQAKPFWELEIPMINLSNAIPTKRFPKSVMDEALVGRMAAEHLIERGYEQFLCMTTDNHPAAFGRASAFRSHLQKKGHDCTFIAQPTTDSGQHNGLISEEMVGKILELTKFPTGLFCWFDLAAFKAMKATLGVDKRIPEEIGIIGANNDDLVVDIAPIPLTSIDLHWEKAAVSAMQMLREWLEGTRPADRFNRDCELVVRNSTRRHPVRDAVLSKCLSLVEARLAGDLSLPVLAQHSGTSERSLNNRFRQYLKTTPARYVLQRRMKRAKRLLKETDLPVYEVAEACGFDDPNYFSATFRRETGETASGYRKHPPKPGRAD